MKTKLIKDEVHRRLAAAVQSAGDFFDLGVEHKLWTKDDVEFFFALACWFTGGTTIDAKRFVKGLPTYLCHHPLMAGRSRHRLYFDVQSVIAYYRKKCLKFVWTKDKDGFTFPDDDISLVLALLQIRGEVTETGTNDKGETLYSSCESDIPMPSFSLL